MTVFYHFSKEKPGFALSAIETQQLSMLAKEIVASDAIKVPRLTRS